MVKFDLKAIQEAGYDIVTPVIITNSSEYVNVSETEAKTVKAQDETLKVFK